MIFYFLSCASIEQDSGISDIQEDTSTISSSDSAEAENDYEVPSYDVGVYTFAGSGDNGVQDGVQTNASFSTPKYMTVSSDGTLYLSEASTETIRRISLDGDVETLYLSGKTVVDPAGIAVNDAGDIFLADSGQHCILRISNMVASVFAGSCGTLGMQDGSSALFYNPKDILFDHDNNLIVADAGNSRIRSISPEGITSTIAGKDGFGAIEDGVATEVITYMPFGLALDPSGGIYISGLDNCIRYLHDQRIETVAGFCQNFSNSGDADGVAHQASFDTPMAIAVGTQGELYIADTLNHKIRVLSPNRENVSTLTGSTAGYQDGSLSESLFYTPRSLVFIEDILLVVDSENHRIRLIQQ